MIRFDFVTMGWFQVGLSQQVVEFVSPTLFGKLPVSEDHSCLIDEFEDTSLQPSLNCVSDEIVSGTPTPSVQQEPGIFHAVSRQLLQLGPIHSSTPKPKFLSTPQGDHHSLENATVGYSSFPDFRRLDHFESKKQTANDVWSLQMQRSAICRNSSPFPDT